MANKYRLPEHDFTIDPDDIGLDERHSFKHFFDELDESIPKDTLENSIQVFEEEKERLKKAMQRSIKILRTQSLLTGFLIWSKKNLVGNGFPDYPKKLFDKKIIKFTHSNGELVIIKEINNKDILDTTNAIRCRKDFDIGEREMLVSYYLDFMQWIRSITFSVILKAVDPDRQKTLGRWLDYDVFINLLSKLDNRCQLVAKLLYFGGTRVLSEVLNLDLREIDFEKKLISYDSFHVSYPLHVFEDVKSLVGIRKEGKLFLGKNETSLNAATIFRNFKDAALQIGFEGEFSPKMLSTDI